MRARYTMSLALGAVGISLLGAWGLCEALGFAEALPILVGEVPATGGLEWPIFQAGSLIVTRLAAVVLAAPALLASVADAAFVSLAAWQQSEGKGPTPEPVGSTGGGL